jgi:hypothetical protein
MGFEFVGIRFYWVQVLLGTATQHQLDGSYVNIMRLKIVYQAYLGILCVFVPDFMFCWGRNSIWVKTEGSKVIQPT